MTALACFVLPVPKAYAAIDDGSLARIIAELQITEASPGQVRQVLDAEIDSGWTVGEQVDVTLAQISLGNEVRSGAFLLRYQGFFASVIDRTLDRSSFWTNHTAEAIQSIIVNIARVDLLGEAANLLKIAAQTTEVFIVFGEFVDLEVDKLIFNYIDLRRSGETPESAWAEALAAFPLRFSAERLAAIRGQAETSYQAVLVADQSEEIKEGWKSYILQ